MSEEDSEEGEEATALPITWKLREPREPDEFDVALETPNANVLARRVYQRAGQQWSRLSLSVYADVFGLGHEKESVKLGIARKNGPIWIWNDAGLPASLVEAACEMLREAANKITSKGAPT